MIESTSVSIHVTEPSCSQLRDLIQAAMDIRAAASVRLTSPDEFDEPAKARWSYCGRPVNQVGSAESRENDGPNIRVVGIKVRRYVTRDGERPRGKKLHANRTDHGQIV